MTISGLSGTPDIVTLMTTDPTQTPAPTGQDALRGSTHLLDPEFAAQLGAQLAADDDFQALLATNNHNILQSVLGESCPAPEWMGNITAQFAPAPNYAADWHVPTLPLAQQWATLPTELLAGTAARSNHGLVPAFVTPNTTSVRWMSSARMLGLEGVTDEISSWAKRIVAIKRNRDQIRALILLALKLERAAQRTIRAGIQIYGLTELLRSTRNRLREAVFRSRTTARLRHRDRRRDPTNPPGHTVAARPRLSRGPNTCRSIATPRSPAGLTHV